MIRVPEVGLEPTRGCPHWILNPKYVITTSCYLFISVAKTKHKTLLSFILTYIVLDDIFICMRGIMRGTG